MRRGTYIQARYRVDAHLGTGDLGSIWNGTDTLLDRPVTIKVLHPELANDDTIRDRFRHTAMRIAALHSPEIIDIYDHIEQFTFDNDVLACQISGPLSGIPLSRLLRQERRLDTQRTLTIVGRTARALHLAHRASVTHRNLKPGNVLLGANDTITLIGFGFLDTHATPSTHSPDQPSSSVPYAAPELFDKRPATPASDIYSLGTIAYECLSGHNPFDRETATDIAAAHARVTPPELPPDIPWQARQAVTGAMAKRPGDRHESARAMAELCGVTDGFSDTSDDETITLALPTAEPPRETGAVARGKARIATRAASDDADENPQEPQDAPHGDLAPLTARRLPHGDRHKSYKHSAIVAVVVLALTGSGLLAHFGFPVAAEEPRSHAVAPTSAGDDLSSPTPSASSSSSQESSSTQEPSSSSSSSQTSSTPSSSSSSSSSSSESSSEPEDIPVPGVIGLSAPAATDQLRAAELSANVEHEGEGDVECAVHAQDPAAGTELPPGASVTVNVRLAATEEECQQPV